MVLEFILIHIIPQEWLINPGEGLGTNYPILGENSPHIFCISARFAKQGTDCSLFWTAFSIGVCIINSFGRYTHCLSPKQSSDSLIALEYKDGFSLWSKGQAYLLPVTKDSGSYILRVSLLQWNPLLVQEPYTLLHITMWKLKFREPTHAKSEILRLLLLLWIINCPSLIQQSRVF